MLGDNAYEESDSEKQRLRDRFKGQVELFHLLCDLIKAVNQTDVPHLRRLFPWLYSYLVHNYMWNSDGRSCETFVDQVRNKKGPPCLKSVSDSFVSHADHKLKTRSTLKKISGYNYEHSEHYTARNDWQKYLDTAYKTQKDAAKVNAALGLRVNEDGGRIALPNVKSADVLSPLKKIDLATLNHILAEYLGGDPVSKPRTIEQK